MLCGLALGLAALGLAALQPRPARADWDSQAEGLMSRGQYRLAGSVYRKRLRRDPTDPWAPLGIARAQGASGRCDLATPTLEAGHAGSAWDVRLSLATARCHLQEGNLVDAVYFIDEALDQAPDSGAVLTRAMVVAAEAGDPVLQARVDLLLEELPPDSPMLSFGHALAALESHDLDALFVDIYDLRTTPAWRTWSDLLAARAWLEVDDPAAAIRAGLAKLTTIPRPLVQVWLAEAFRRDGQADHALMLLTMPKQRVRTDLIKRAFLLRAQADVQIDAQADAAAQGTADPAADSLAELDRQARQLLAEHPLDPQVLISAWYLAHVLDDQARANSLADALRRVRDDADAELVHVLPLDTRTP